MSLMEAEGLKDRDRIGHIQKAGVNIDQGAKQAPNGPGFDCFLSPGRYNSGGDRHRSKLEISAELILGHRQSIFHERS